MRHIKVLLVCSGLAVFALSVAAQAVPLPPTAQPMEPADVRKVFSGKTLLAPSFDAFLDTAGTAKGVFGKPKIIDTFVGTWSVKDNEFCMETRSPRQDAPARDCFKLWKDRYRVFTLWSLRSDGAAIDEVNGYQPFAPRTRAGDIVSQRYEKAGGS